MNSACARRWLVLALVPIVMGVAGTSSLAWEDSPAELPRYRLRVGQELTYRGSNDFAYERGSLAYAFLDRAWVTRHNPDGSWRVVLCYQNQMTQQSKPKLNSLKSIVGWVATKAQEAAKAAPGTPADEEPGDRRLAYVDLHPDGRVILNESITASFNPVAPETIFPPLPASADQARQGWHDDNPGTMEARNDYQLAPEEAGNVVILATHRNMFDKIYLSSAKSRFTFDPKQGIVTGVANENNQGYGFVGKGTGGLSLTGTVDHDAAWVATMARESEVFFTASLAYQDALKQANRATADVASVLAAAETGLKEAQARLTLPMFAGALDAQIKQHAASASYYIKEAKTRDEAVGQPAAEWELKDLAGQTHTLAGYRGQVVVLDFWYRGCGWCIRAMPQMKQLADDFHGQPVAILGMNKDANLKDAQFVADAMGLNYPTLVQAESVPEKYKVRGFPTLVIVDPRGKIAEVHVGYSPTLREEVGGTIRRLLREQPGIASSPKAN